MSASQAANERKRMKHAAVIAAKPDASFLVQVIAGAGSRNSYAENKTAPIQGAAAYSIVMDSAPAVRSLYRADALNHAV